MVAMTIALAITGATFTTAGIGTFAIAFVISMAISMAVSMVLNEILSPSQSSGQVDAGNSRDPGVDSRLRINTENRVGVGYGTFWVKGAEVYGQAASDFKTAYYAMVLTESIGNFPNSLQKVFWEEYELTISPGIGYVSSVTVNNGDFTSGGGIYPYQSRPTISFSAPPSGSVATAIVNMEDVYDPENGSYSYVSSVTVTSGGSGYTSTPAYALSYIPDTQQEASLTVNSVIIPQGWVTNAVDAAGNNVSDFNNNVRVQFYPNGLPSDRSALPNIAWFQTGSNWLSSYSCVVITVKYNRDKQLFALKDMSFCLSNGLTRPGDVLYDYFTNGLYGCGLSPSQVDTQSLTALNAYSDEMLPSVTSTGVAVNLPRYRLNGVVNTNQNCWKNVEDLMFSCGCYPRANNQAGQYGVYIDRATDQIAYGFDDSTITGQSQIVTAEFSSVPNQVEVKFPRLTVPQTGAPDVRFKGQQDTFNLAIPASALPANSQPNQYVLEYRYIANDVQAKRLAAVDLNNNALDLSYTFRTSFKAMDVMSGDVVAITSQYNGWFNKRFRVLSVAEIEDPTTGNIQLEFFVKEYDPAVYVDSTIVQYPPAPNVNGPSVRYKQSFVPAAPVPTGIDLTIPVPSLSLQFTIPAGRIEDQIDIYYMVGTPDITKAIFAFTVYGSQNDGSFGTGTFTFPVLGNGGLYAPQVVPPGDYYFACKYFNDGLASEWSDISTKVSWRPQTQQWNNQYAMFRWADSDIGGGMTTNPDGKRFMGVYNSFNPVSPTDPSLYQWFDLGSPISKSNQQFFRIYQNRVLSYRMALANPDSTLYTSCYNFPDPSNPIFNLDETTGFYVKTAYQAAGNNYLTSIWNADGSITYLLPKGTSVPGTTPITEIGGITVDNEGRVISYEQGELIYMTIQQFTAASVNETFAFVHTVGQAMFFMNGMLLDPADYSETANDFTVPTSKAGYTLMAIGFMENTASGYVAPYVRTNIPTVQGQTDYTVDMNEGCELVFINGVFMASVDYDTPVNNVLRLGVAPLYSNQNLTVINFRPLNQIASPFTQALGSTVGGNTTVEMSSAVSSTYSLVSICGSLLSSSDYTTFLNSVNLTAAPVFTGDIVQATSFVAAGPTSPVLPPFPAAAETLGDIIHSIETRLIQVETKA